MMTKVKVHFSSLIDCIITYLMVLRDPTEFLKNELYKNAYLLNNKEVGQVFGIQIRVLEKYLRHSSYRIVERRLRKQRVCTDTSGHPTSLIRWDA